MRLAGWTVSGLLLVAMALLASPGSVAAQDCLEAQPQVLLDSRSLPDALPTTPRAHALQLLRWQGGRYLAGNDGNGLRLWSLGGTTTEIGRHVFACFNGCIVEPAGDTDYQLHHFSVCDDCRYGVASLGPVGTVLFDLGQGSTPDLVADTSLLEDTQSYGSLTFAIGGQQYLVINNHPNGCGATGKPALLQLGSIDEADAVNLQCLETAGGSSFQVAGGLVLEGSAGVYVYLVSTSGQVHIYKVSGSGSELALAYRGSPFPASIDYGSGIRADEANGLLITTLGDAAIWDISGTRMGAPVKLADLDPFLDQQVVLAAIRYPYAWVGRKASTASYTFDITVPSAPQPLDQGFWDAANSWNDQPYLLNFDAELSEDGTVLYLARYSVLQQISTRGCDGASPPVAGLTLSPQPAFPGDQVTVTDTSTGIVEQSAVWVSNAGGGIIAGSDTLSSNGPASLELVLPDDLGIGDSFQAHVAVANAANPFRATVPGGQLATRAIDIDRAPQVIISVSPPTALIGGEVTLSAEAEGHPEQCSWEVQPPSGATIARQGCTTSITLDQGGEWLLRQTASYRHQALEGGLYQAVYELALPVSSVAAAFTITPAAPTVSEDAVLDAGTTTALAGAQLGYHWTVVGPVRYDSCGDVAVCSIPAGALPIGTYQVTLVVSNTGNGDTSTSSRSMQVLAQAEGVAFTPSATSTNIGEAVVFTITRAPEGFESASWVFGGPGCDDPSQTRTCQTSDGSCRSEAYTYATSGGKTVTLSVWRDGVRHDAQPVTINVYSSGTCGGACRYGIYPGTTQIDAGGGDGWVRVTAGGGDCDWTAITYASWLHLTGVTEGTQTAEITFSVDPNPGPERTGSIFVAGYIHKVTQAASPDFKLEITASNRYPVVGEEVVLTAGDTATPVSWNLGGRSCDGLEPERPCSFLPRPCREVRWRFAEPGRTTITLQAREGTVSTELTVLGSGSCDEECLLDANPAAELEISSQPVVIGVPVVLSAVAPASEVPSSEVDVTADSWAWEISRDGLLEASGSGATFEHVFAEEGLYTVELAAANCHGSSTVRSELQVLRFPPVPDQLVPVVAHADGSNGTAWRSELRLLNPGALPAEMSIELLPDQRSAETEQSLQSLTLSVPPMTTELLGDILTLLPGFTGESSKGALRLRYLDGDGTPPVVVSRTYNDTPEGTYGQYIPSILIPAEPASQLFFTGLQHNEHYRTNLGCINYGERWAGGIGVAVLGSNGDIIGSTGIGLRPATLQQVANIATSCGVTTNLDGFTLRVDPTGNQVICYAAVVENSTGDAVYSGHLESTGGDRLVIPGVAHLQGLGDSLWLSDITLFNLHDTLIEPLLSFFPEDSEKAPVSVQLQLSPAATLALPDVLAQLLEGDAVQQKGYLQVSVAEGSVLPGAAARTYNLTGNGAFGQRLGLFSAGNSLAQGDRGYLVGLRSAADEQSGFRSNLGLLNLSEDSWAVVLGTLYEVDGEVLQTVRYELFPGRFVQRNLLRDLGLEGQELSGTLELVVESGGPVAAYLSVIDNRSQDPHLLPVIVVSN